MTNETDPKIVFVFNMLEETKVGITDLSRLTRISRVTLHRWKKGGPVADNLRKEIAYKTALRLQKALTLGELPLVDSYSPKARLQVLQGIVRKMARK